MISKVPSRIRILEAGRPEIANVFLNVLNLCLGTIYSFERWVLFFCVVNLDQNISLSEK